VVLLQVAGFAFPVSTQARAATPVALRIGFLSGIESLSPFRGINDADYLFYGLVYDYLFALDEDGNPLPNIATDAAPDAYGANWTYTIRPGVKWHDGSALTVDDVAFSINKNIENFFQLWAYEPYVNRIIQCSSQTRPYCGAVVGPNPDQVTVYFDRPYVPGKALYVPIIKQSQWGGWSPSQIQYNYDNLNPIGTGEYKADANIGTQWQNGDPLLLHRNTDYHLGVPAIDDIYLVHYSDEAAMVQAMLAGDVDVAEFTPAGYATLENRPNIARQEALLSTQYWVEIGVQQNDAPAVNNRLNPTRWDENVRRALAMATDRDFVVNAIYQGKGVRGSSLMSPLTPFWYYDPADPSMEPDPSVNLTFDIAAANDLLNRSGYTVWSGGSFGNGVRSNAQPITVNVQTNAYPQGTTKTIPAGTALSFSMAVRQEYIQEQDTAKYLVEQWKQIGVQLTYSVMLEPALSDAVYGGTVETYIWYWSGDPDPNYLLSIESGFTLDGWSDNYWDNSTYNQLYIDHLAAADPLERQAIVRQAEKVHYESAVYIILIYNMGQWAYRTDRFTGWGDWVTHPYRQLNAFWTANPLFLDLRPIAAPDVALSDTSGRPGQAVTISGTITDQQAGTWTLSFGDSSPDATGSYPAGGGSVSEAHTYAAAGTYTIRLTADNGIFARTATGTVTIQAAGNLRPTIVPIVADKTTGLAPLQVNFTLAGHDPDGGDLTFTINYDDGSAPEARTVTNVAPNADATATFTHRYTAVGSHFATGNVSDGELVSTNERIEIVVQSVQTTPPSGGIDARYAALGVVVVIAAAAVAAMLLRRRRRKEEESGLPPPPPPR